MGHDFYSGRTTDLRNAVAASTLQGAIRNFLQALELTDTQSSMVANRQQLVRERATSSAGLMDIEKTQLIGSYSRDTQIRSLDARDFIDVDSLLILKNTEWNLNKYWRSNDGGSKALEDLRASLEGYQGLTVAIDRPAVTITWSNMKMEMVPAFRRQGGGFLIPSGNGWQREWQNSDPVTDGDIISEANKASNGDFKPIAKMIKCWNRTNAKVLGSFALETVLYHTTKSSFKGLEFEMSWFFKKLAEYNRSSLSAPSEIGSPIFINLNLYQIGHVQSAEQNIRSAFSLANAGKHAEAISLMARVFGRPFQGSR